MSAIPTLDPRHARIEKRENDFIIRDLRSSTGTFLNGSRVIEAFLRDGDLIEVGPHHFTFSIRNDKDFKAPTKSLPKSKNPEWNSQLELLPQMSQTHFPILILGPSGSGKEVISEAIHKNSFRRNGPLVRVNCSALTETLIESELFGHVKGSFTGAIADRKGAFEAARGGTLFLDEMGDLPYGLQAKLLRALENNEIRPVGSDKTIKTDVRIIAATHKNLKQKIAEGEFRQDLYYRLNVIQISAPALNERMEDFEDLLFHFAREFRVRFSPACIEKLKRYSWPGNIRELKNTVARASVLFPNTSIEEFMLPRILDSISPDEKYLKEKPSNDLSVIKEIERQMIIKRLAANAGNQRQTARDLGMPKSTLHDRIRVYNIDISQFKN
jgi:DNA-binding NtrC family response regulator